MATETGDLNAAHLYTELIHQGFLDGINDVVDFRGLPFINLASVDEMVTGVRSDVAIKVFGDDIETLRLTADQIRRVFVGFQKYLYEARPS